MTPGLARKALRLENHAFDPKYTGLLGGISFMTKSVTTRINEDGLRYRSKTVGSPFASKANTRSCFKCGKHRTPDQLQSKKLLGKTEMVCKPSCKELAEALGE
jgi:hypothetical protein